MRKLLLLLIQLHISLLIAFGQEENPIIESIEISGVDESRITSELRDRMKQLVGQRYDQAAVDQLAYEIQDRLTERIGAIRQTPGTPPDSIRIVFEIGTARTERGRDNNVNSRYIVEDVELRGIADSLISSRLRDDMRKLVGERLDDERAEAIERRLDRELRPARVVSRRVTRGADRTHVRVIYEVEKAPLFQFLKKGNYLFGHQKQSVSFGFEDGWQHKSNRLAAGFFNDGNQLLERFAGYTLTFENIRTGTEHLGVRVHYFNFHEKWKPATELALKSSPNVPGVYRERRGVEPSVTFAFDRRLRVTAGASVTELQMQYPAIHFLNSNAATLGVTYQDQWNESERNRHRVLAAYSVRTATRRLDSDFIYTRHFGDVRYAFRSSHNQIVARAAGGVITGAAPLFERFSLGNTSTLRGWNKYDLAPLGGTRMAHGSVEYRFTVLQVFYDAGSVWEKGRNHATSHSVGFGFHGRDNDGDWFFTFGVPIRSGRIQPLKPVFMLGGHF